VQFAVPGQRVLLVAGVLLLLLLLLFTCRHTNSHKPMKQKKACDAQVMH
jgi:hypothetical protein